MINGCPITFIENSLFFENTMKSFNSKVYFLKVITHYVSRTMFSHDAVTVYSCLKEMNFDTYSVAGRKKYKWDCYNQMPEKPRQSS